MRNNIFLALKSMLYTILALLFTFFMLLVLNEGMRKIYGKGMSLYFSNMAIYFNCGDRQFKVEPNIEKTAKLVSLIYEHPGLLPVPFKFMELAECMLYNFF